MGTFSKSRDTSQILSCLPEGIHYVCRVQKGPPSPCLRWLKALADQTRWEIVHCLLGKDRTAMELTEKLKVSQYNISKHLRILREAGIISQEKEGRFVICRIVPEFRQNLKGSRKSLDLGCCTFRF
jgi:DNA-binding transcriptional ArsR family regulator